MNNQHKYALVSGASSGIGWHISRELAQRGYSIIAVSNQPEQLDKLRQMLEKDFSVSVYPLNIDLAREAAAQEVFDYCAAKHLEPEVLVNNAGILVVGEALELEFSKAQSVLQLHVTTPALLCNLFGKQMLLRKRGFILNISSISSVMPYPVISLYGPTKTFMRSFTRALRSEVRHRGIHVTCVMPGATATALYDTQRVNVPLAMKLGVMKKPEYVARAGVAALFADHAECIPGMLNKLIVFLIPLIPDSMIAFLYRQSAKRRLNVKCF